MRPVARTYEVRVSLLLLRGNRTSLVTKSEEFVSFRARLLESLKTGNTQKEQNSRTCLAGRRLDRWGWSQAGDTHRTSATYGMHERDPTKAVILQGDPYGRGKVFVFINFTIPFQY